MEWKQIRSWMTNIAYLIALVVAIDSGYGFIFMLVSGLMLSIIYRKGLWKLMINLRNIFLMYMSVKTLKKEMLRESEEMAKKLKETMNERDDTVDVNSEQAE